MSSTTFNKSKEMERKEKQEQLEEWEERKEEFIEKLYHGGGVGRGTIIFWFVWGDASV